MSVVQNLHMTAEFWGALFCLVALLVVLLTRQFDRQGSLHLALVLICSTALMASDGLSWIARGANSESWYLILHITYVGSLFFGFLMMPLIAGYVSHIIYKRTDGYRLYWNMVEWIIFFIGVLLLVINEFYPFMFKIEMNCTITQMPVFRWIPSLIVLIGLLMTLSVSIFYLKYLLKVEKVALISLLLLPIISSGFYYFFPEVSYTKLSAVISTIILFVSYEVYYAHYLVEKEKQVSDEKLRVINRQMHPHFIFNSLALIRRLCKKSPDEAVEVINEFSGFLRSTTDFLSENDCISAEREIELVRNYISIQRKRFGNNLRVQFEIEDTDFDVPPFSIQTIVENAVHHGVKDGQVENGLIRIETMRSNYFHYVIVSDNGQGFDTSILEKKDGSVGFRNTRDRLRIMCDGEILVESSPELGTKVTMQIPV